MAVGGRTAREDVAQILAIHHEDVIETGEVVVVQLAGAVAREVDAALLRVADGARVSTLTGVPATGAAGGNDDVDTAAFRFVADSGFGGGGAADVAEADHQDAHRCRLASSTPAHKDQASDADDVR